MGSVKHLMTGDFVQSSRINRVVHENSSNALENCRQRHAIKQDVSTNLGEHCGGHRELSAVEVGL